MLPSQEPAAVSSVRKLCPQAKLPTAAVLRSLMPEDLHLLDWRLSEPVECVFDACFQQAGAEKKIMGPMPVAPRKKGRKTLENDDSGVDLLAVPRGRTLTVEQERWFFLRLNYARYRVMRVLRLHRDKRLTAQATRELLHWERMTHQTRSEIVRINVALVLAMSKRTRITGVDFADLISEGNLALLRAVDKFDCSRGFKLSTYACRAILKSFSRVAARTARYRGYFPIEFDPDLEKSDYLEQKRVGVEGDCVLELRAVLGRNSAQLNEVERQVIRARFALDEPADGSDLQKAKTLEQVGLMIGVTKERVRQIQNKALVKLRGVLEEGVLSV